ncbi:MAG: pyridoxamine 5'-phosphate oxidase family protein [Eubacteriales bacterium]|nr:pyridoxamine 5'-phosphate oxidase family protein [Eubacteriales bacterium]
MRRKDREITEYSKMLDILSECDCCRLGLIDENGAYIVPLNFGFEMVGDKLYLYFHGASVGKKIDLIKKQKKASFEMDRKYQLYEGETPCTYSFFYQSVMGNGTIQLLDDYDEKVSALSILMSHYSDKGQLQFQKEYVEMVSVIKLEVINWSCKEH